MFTHLTYDIIQNLIIISLCLSMVYPKGIERYRKRKKLRETQEEQRRQEEIRKIVVEFLEEIKKDG